MHADPAWSRALLRRFGAEDLAAHALRRMTDGAGNDPVLDLKLKAGAVSFAVARAFVERHHRHCAAPRGWRFGFTVFNRHARVGVLHGVALSSGISVAALLPAHVSVTKGAVKYLQSLAPVLAG